MIPNEPKFKIGDTVILKFYKKKYFLCEIVGAEYHEREMSEGISTWRYALKIGGRCPFQRWESELFLNEERIEECKKIGGKYRVDFDYDVFCKLEGKEEYRM